MSKRPQQWGFSFVKKQSDVRETFTIIYHDIRIKLGLNLLDYILLDTIFILSQNNKGYCYKSIRALGKDLNISVGGVHKSLRRLIDSKNLTKVEGGYRASQDYIDAIDTRRSQSEQTTKKKRSQSEQGDHKVNTSVHFVQEKQMLDIHKNNNRKTHGTPRDNSRVPQLSQPFSPVALKLQQRLKQMQNKGTA